MILAKAGKANLHPRVSAHFHKDNAAPSLAEVAWCDQSAHSAGEPGGRCHIQGWVLVFAPGRLGNQLCSGPIPSLHWIRLLRPKRNLQPWCFSRLIHGLTDQGQRSLGKEMGWILQNQSPHPPDYLAHPYRGSSLVNIQAGHRCTYALPVWKGLVTHHFRRFPCHHQPIMLLSNA